MNASGIKRDDFDAGPTSIDCVEQGLWIGNLTAALDTSTLEKLHVTHILTVDVCPLPRNILFLPDIKTMFIQATDLPYEDLLSHFDDTHNFIKSGQENGVVLLHCYFGVSRSATIVVAYLMKKYSLCFDDALDRLKKLRKLTCPNKGFENQLRLYEAMKYTVDRNNLQFKMFRLRVTANKVAKAKIVPSDCMDVIKPDPSLTSAKPECSVYRCKRCRRIVASANSIMLHIKGQKSSWKDPKWSGDYSQLAENICSEMYFIEPMRWISGVTNSESGKICCPKCGSKLGSYSWIMGSTCVCKAKVSPSFYLVPSKVDYSNIVQNVQITL